MASLDSVQLDSLDRRVRTRASTDNPHKLRGLNSCDSLSIKLHVLRLFNNAHTKRCHKTIDLSLTYLIAIDLRRTVLDDRGRGYIKRLTNPLFSGFRQGTPFVRMGAPSASGESDSANLQYDTYVAYAYRSSYWIVSFTHDGAKGFTPANGPANSFRPPRELDAACPFLGARCRQIMNPRMMRLVIPRRGHAQRQFISQRQCVFIRWHAMMRCSRTDV